MKLTLHRRPGLTLVELTLFIALLALSSGAVVGFLMTSSESRVRQEAVGQVEENGVRLLQILQSQVRQAERIVAPAAGGSGAILALQYGDTETGPVIIAAQSGAMLMIQGDTEYAVSPSEVVVSDVRVFNTSPSAARPSLALRFTISSRIPLPTEGVYRRTFESGIVLFPVDQPTGNACGCAAPVCARGYYQWQLCASGTCRGASGSLLCH